MKHCRAAVLGAGFMGSMHAAIFDSLRGVDVIAVVDSDEARARQVAATLRGAQPFPTLEVPFAGGPVDVVSICTRDHLHREPVLLGAARGAHLLVEKSIAATVEDAEAMRQACERAGVQLGVGYLLRFDPRYAQAKALLDEGRLGEPIHLYARRNSPRSEGTKRYGGELPLPLHVTVHDVDLVLWLLAGRRPVSVYAWNSVTVSALSTASSVALGAIAAYGLVNLTSRARQERLDACVLGLRSAPAVLSAIPAYYVASDLGAIDNLVLLVLVYVFVNTPFAASLLVTFFREIPGELREAARLDGACACARPRSPANSAMR